jgi:3'-phosphoadenosine 5'-phosphosulfate sulfotransferase (PAPS reductase)/FAD synthetase
MTEAFILETDAADAPASTSTTGYTPGTLLAVAFGGGINSTAMLCGFRERGIKPDLILFADTGGELPETYEHVIEMDTQCRIWWGVGGSRFAGIGAQLNQTLSSA